MKVDSYDKIIIGGGLYGLYSALHCGQRGERVLVLERDAGAFGRATYVNQARVHMGYHYPRSISTALKSKGYFERFYRDFGFCVHTEFRQIYATSADFSWTNAEQFCNFCRNADIRCDRISPSLYFKDGMCDGSFITTEYTYDANLLKDYIIREIEKYPSIEIRHLSDIIKIENSGRVYEISLASGERITAPFVLNATYASVNQIQNMLGFEPFKIKYELCEIILCNISEKLKHIGLTVMDGPFFSIMPFGKTGLHSLTSVTFTPHQTSYEPTPVFNCQNNCLKNYCTPDRLGNCNACTAKPTSSWSYMNSLAQKYIKDEFRFEYVQSLFSMKPILKASEIDDSRPTVIRKFSENPTFISVLSGKINTVYDLDEVLD